MHTIYFGGKDPHRYSCIPLFWLKVQHHLTFPFALDAKFHLWLVYNSDKNIFEDYWDLQITIQDLEDMIQPCKGNKTEKSTDVSEKHNWSTSKSGNKEV